MQNQLSRSKGKGCRRGTDKQTNRQTDKQTNIPRTDQRLKTYEIFVFQFLFLFVHRRSNTSGRLKYNRHEDMDIL